MPHDGTMSMRMQYEFPVHKHTYFKGLSHKENRYSNRSDIKSTHTSDIINRDANMLIDSILQFRPALYEVFGVDMYFLGRNFMAK